VVRTMNLPKSVVAMAHIMPSPLKEVNREEDENKLSKLANWIVDSAVRLGLDADLGEVQSQGGAQRHSGNALGRLVDLASDHLRGGVLCVGLLQPLFVRGVRIVVAMSGVRRAWLVQELSPLDVAGKRREKSIETPRTSKEVLNRVTLHESKKREASKLG